MTARDYGGLTLLGAALLAACQSTTAAGGGGGGAGTTGIGGGAPTSGVVVKVTAARANEPEVPAEGATVALDLPDGSRLEKKTDATGTALFDGFSWGSGVGAVTAHLAAYALRSRLGVGLGDTVRLTLSAPAAPSASQVKLSGLAKGMTNADENLLYVAPLTAPGTSSELMGGEWDVRVPKNTALALVALEYTPDLRVPQPSRANLLYGWKVVDVPAVTKDTVVDIDFAAGLAPTKEVTGAMKLPALGAASPLASVYGYLRSKSVGASTVGVLGLPKLVEINTTAKTVDYTAQYIEPPQVDAAYTEHVLRGTTAGSVVQIDGYPKSGTWDPGFFDAPAPTSTGCFPLSDAIAWTNPAEGVTPRLNILAGGAVGWVVDGTAGSTRMKVPAPPSSCTADALCTGTGTLDATLLVHKGTVGGGRFLERYSFVATCVSR